MTVCGAELVLLGRYLEARAKRRAGAALRALRALLSLGAKDVAVLRGGAEVRVPVAELAVGEEFVVRPGEKIESRAARARVTGPLPGPRPAGP
jgi:cation transport ATPase